MVKRNLGFASIILGISLLVLSCSSSKKAADTVSRNDLKGNWLLDNITYEGLPQDQALKLTLLDEGSDECLKGSTWVLPNNGYGSYSIAQSGAGCTAGERNIVWSHRVEKGQDIFQYKRLAGGEKAKNITDGYKFTIVSATDNNLLLSSKVDYGGSTISINYSFVKSN